MGVSGCDRGCQETYILSASLHEHLCASPCRMPACAHIINQQDGQVLYRQEHYKGILHVGLPFFVRQ